jgi:hypothetical protein
MRGEARRSASLGGDGVEDGGERGASQTVGNRHLGRVQDRVDAYTAAALAARCIADVDGVR